MLDKARFATGGEIPLQGGVIGRWLSAFVGLQ